MPDLVVLFLQLTTLMLRVTLWVATVFEPSFLARALTVVEMEFVKTTLEFVNATIKTRLASILPLVVLPLPLLHQPTPLLKHPPLFLLQLPHQLALTPLNHLLETTLVLVASVTPLGLLADGAHKTSQCNLLSKL
jgi:hypothetical protein